MLAAVATGLLVCAALAVVGRGRSGTALAAIGRADDEWVLLAAVAAGASYVAAALGQLGAVPTGGHLPAPGLGRLVLVQVACAFTNRLLPAGAGAMATNARALRRCGLTPEQTRAAVSTNALGGVVAHVLTLVAVSPVLLALGPVRRLLVASPYALVTPLAVAVAVGGVLLRPPPLVARGVRWLGLSRAQLRDVVASPRRSALVLGGSVGITGAHAACFVAALHAVGLALPVPVALALYVVAVAVAGVVPVPGGVGGVDATLVLGLLAAGAAQGPAAAAVLAFRLVSFWLPAVPGALVLLWLLRRRWV